MRQFECFELRFSGDEPADSHVQIPLTAEFQLDGKKTTVKGFYAGAGTYILRYYPQGVGTCTWKVSSTALLSGMVEGSEACLPAESNTHGMVRAKGLHFCYDDGVRYQPFGTTVYALIHQEDALVAETMESLRNAPFNKIRLCVFPKHYDYNHNDPVFYPFEKSEDGGWDVHRPCFAYWDRLEQGIAQLGKMGIEADLILFHGYDRWGFSKLSREQCLVYLDYLVRRLAALPNVWWSLANEYEVVTQFEPHWWKDFAAFIGANDPYHHLLSNHNFLALWDFDDENVTHCSIQDPRVIRVPDLQKRYKKPVIFDECCYEGDIPFAWGNLSAFELVNRFWIAHTMGGYCTHGETYLSSDDILWWAKGGKLKGESAPRIAFLRQIMAQLPGELEYVKSPYEMVMENPEKLKEAPAESAEVICAVSKLLQEVSPQRYTDFFDQNRLVMGHYEDEVFLMYMGRQCCSKALLQLPNEGSYDVEAIDIWEMTRTKVMSGVNGSVFVTLPGKEGMAVLAKKRKS